MTNLVISANTSVLAPAQNAGIRAVEGTRDGAIFVADYKMKMGLQGRIFVANTGSVTTPATFLVTAANRPDFVLRVPLGTTCVPFLLNIAIETTTGTVNECDLRICKNDIGNGATSAAADVGPISCRTDAPVVSNVIPRQLYAADATAETSPISIYRRTFPLANATALIDYTIYWEPTYAPMLVGPASFEVFLAGTGAQSTGYLVCNWMEWPSTHIV